MEVINKKVAIVYKRKDEDEKDWQDHNIWGNSKTNGKLIKWEVLYRIRKIPSKLACSGLKLFSPNFRFMLDFSYETQNP